MGLGRGTRQKTVNDRQFRRACAHHLASDRAEAGGIFSQRTFLEWICFHKLKITARETFGRYAKFSFRACRDPPASRGILRRYFPAWAAWHSRLAWELAEIDAAFSGKPAFARQPQIWRWVFSYLLFRGLRVGFDKPQPFINA